MEKLFMAAVRKLVMMQVGWIVLECSILSI